jgi:hypothetical protein
MQLVSSPEKLQSSSGGGHHEGPETRSAQGRHVLRRLSHDIHPGRGPHYYYYYLYFSFFTRADFVIGLWAVRFAHK